MQGSRAWCATSVRRQKSKKTKAASVLFIATIGGKEWQVKYECSVTQSGTPYTECVRLAAEKGKALPATGPRLARDITNGTAIFTYSPSAAEPKLVTVKLELPAQGTLKQAGSSGYKRKVVLEDAAFMRNLYLEG